MYKVFDNFYLQSEVITAQEAIGSVPNLGWFPLGSFSKITMAFSIHKKYKVVQKKNQANNPQRVFMFCVLFASTQIHATTVHFLNYKKKTHGILENTHDRQKVT